MVGDGAQLRVGEAVDRLAELGVQVSDTTVRDYLTQGLLRATWTAGGHRRIGAASVDELAAVLRIPPGPERAAAMEQLRERNRAAASEASDT